MELLPAALPDVLPTDALLTGLPGCGAIGGGETGATTSGDKEGGFALLLLLAPAVLGTAPLTV